ncbi:hypothetical protein B0J13DRAFT_564612 [Dactylonectria estremocensis]|uniref:Uncharacterized protein n=1 Tax=Dactylonectria estremocensis TaxID=1079267 RepID=A0A9P9DY16_9HYPO|nr:hypothetical protein B0J13DRAFT_564612 [Dactylonectria estremocensis]
MARLDTVKLARDIRQNGSAQLRTAAIVTFGKALRRVDRFQLAWHDVGGAAGLAELMAEFSVRDVRLLCWWMGCSASAIKARPERRAALGELVRMLYEDPGDERPLRVYYQNIVPACTLGVVREWESQRDVNWTISQQERLFRGHRELHERKFLEDIFTPDGKEMRFQTERKLFRGNLPFCEEILSTLVAKEGDVRVPSDFMKELAMPTLKRLLKRRFDEATRNKYLQLIVQCIQKHPKHFTGQMKQRPGELCQYVINRWNDALEESKAPLKKYLVQVIELIPTSEHLFNLGSIHANITSRNLKPDTKYELLRLFMLHLKGYGINIEDESVEGLARLKDIPIEKDLWPAKMFFCIDPKQALRLFENLSGQYPSGDFLAPTSGRTLLRQTRNPGRPERGDIEVARCLLIRYSHTRAEDPSWLERTRMLVQERRIKAQQCREPQDRAFWAKSALGLCIAAGDLDTFGDTVLWARRFNKDPLTVREIYGGQVFDTEELGDLLGVIPKHDTPAAALVTPAAVTRDIGIANRIVFNLIETAAMAVQEPGFQRFNWNSLLHLPKVMTDRRLKNIDSVKDALLKTSTLEGANIELIRNIWKPTMDNLIEIEEFLRRPTSAALLVGSGSVEATGVYVLQNLLNVPASMIAELATFLLQQMNARLGRERVSVQMGNVVEIIMRVARSDQPSLACPFVRNMIMDGDDNSSWHRQLVNVRFLSSLPSKDAREFLFTMADAMGDKMREQNARPRREDKEPTSDKPQPPAIKVTTVKMMAQLLQGSVFIDAQSSCDILVGLLAEARHVDAQITIVSSLISTMEEPTCAPELRTRILDSFEKYILPVASQLSERRALTEADWEAVTNQDNVKLPDISEETPLLAMLVDRARLAKLNLEDKARLAKLVMNVLEQSAVNNSRWMTLFLAKNKFSLDSNERLAPAPTSIRTFPIIAGVFGDLMTYMPASLLNMLRDIILTNLDPSPGIARITKAVKANGDLLNSNGGKHWLAQFDSPGLAAFRMGVHQVALALQRPAHEIKSILEDGEGVDAQMLRDFVLVVAERLVIKGDTGLIDNLMVFLCKKRFERRQYWEAWRANCIPLVKDIIRMIEDIRSGKGGDRLATIGTTQRPPILPNTLRLHIMVLPIPFSSPKEPVRAHEVEAFTSELSALIDKLATRRLPYHEDFARLKEEVLKAPRPVDFATFALQLVDATSMAEPDLADYLRLELVGDLLVKASEPADEDVVRDARAMVVKWKSCEAEGPRAMGLVVADKLAAQGKKGWFGLDQKDQEKKGGK